MDMFIENYGIERPIARLTGTNLLGQGLNDIMNDFGSSIGKAMGSTLADKLNPMTQEDTGPMLL